mgnify:CR=1 FL=1
MLKTGSDQREGRQARDNTSAARKSLPLIMHLNATTTRFNSSFAINVPLSTNWRLFSFPLLPFFSLPLSASSLYVSLLFITQHCTRRCVLAPNVHFARLPFARCFFHSALRVVPCFVSRSRLSLAFLCISFFVSLCPRYSLNTLDFEKFLPLRVLFTPALGNLIGGVVGRNV